MSGGMLTPAQWFRRHYSGNEVPDRLRICLFRGPFPCNAGCRFSQPRRCLKAEEVRAEEAFVEQAPALAEPARTALITSP